MPQTQSLDRLRKNVFIGKHRTSISLETQVWDALEDVYGREEMNLDSVCTATNDRRLRPSMSSSIHMFLLIYFRCLAAFLKQNRSSGSPGFQQQTKMSVLPIFNVTLDRLAAEQVNHL